MHYVDVIWAPWRQTYVVQASYTSECVFCRAVGGSDEENYVVYRSQHTIAILNRYPYNNAHVMIAPKRHVPSTELLNGEELMDLMNTLNRVLGAIRNCYNPHGFNIGANIGKAAGAGIEGHIHVHVVPRWNGDTNFMPVLARAKVIPEDLRETWRKLREHLFR
ncbi:MAG: HIT domain-containing protein [Ignisphaera sp.]|nr:HIT domain-containing protein [Ignisphaera sp.]MCX8167468.1 HIT domain-containing protein [Ignisphaera sp.]MDW8084668.1 HIT domain-containing protein [Ignisphaera sp.]